MESNSLGVPLLEMSADQAVASSSAVELAASITSDAVSSLLLLGKGDNGNKKRDSTASTKQSGPEKIESLYESVDLIRLVLSLIEDTSQYLGSIEDPRIKLAQETLKLSVEEIQKHSNIISSSVNNTKEKKSAKQAHSKLTKDAKRQEADRKLMARRLMKDNPRAALQASMKHVKETLSLASSNSASSGNQATSAASIELASTMQPRKKSKTSEDSTKEFNIRLPRPLNGRPTYTPQEAAYHLHTAERDVENLTGTTNKNTHRSFLRRYKDKMIEEKLVPVQISALNELAKKYGAPDQPTAPLYWDTKGRPEIMDFKEFLEAFKSQQASRVAQGWGIADTKAVLKNKAKQNAEAKGLDPSSVKSPVQETANAYHSTLLSLPEVAQRKSNPKPLHRGVAETSERTVLSNTAGMISSRCIVLQPHEVPNFMKFDEASATPGAIKAREIFAEAVGADVKNVYFSPRSLMFNQDDKASIYQVDGDANEPQEQMLVDRETVTSNPSYSVHDKRDDSMKFRGIKVRFTNTIGGGGNSGRPWVQVLNFSDTEMPKSQVPNGVIVIKLPWPSTDPTSKAFGYIALLRNGQGVETENFRLQDLLVRKPLVESAREALGVKPGDDIPKWCRAVFSIDGGISQLKAFADPNSLQEHVDKNELLVKLAKNSSAVFQSLDTGNIHVRLGHWMKQGGKDGGGRSSINLISVLTAALQKLRDEGKLDITSEKMKNIVKCISLIPEVIRKSFDERGIIQSFAIPGWLDESLQGVDVDKMLGSYKGQMTIVLKDKLLSSLVRCVKDTLKHDTVLEETFEELGHPVDSDSSGKEHHLVERSATQHHRLRFSILTGPTNINLFRQAMASNIAQQESARAGDAEELRWRIEQLEANGRFEAMIHVEHFKREADSDRSLFEYDAVPIDFLGRKSRFAKEFVRVRSMRRKDDPLFQEPKFVGNVANVRATLEKLEDDPEVKLGPKEDTWLLRAVNLFQRPVIMSEDVASLSSSNGQVVASNSPDDMLPPVNERNIIVDAQALVSREEAVHSVIENESLLLNASQTLLGCDFPSVATELMKEQAKALVPKITQRLGNFKQLRLADTNEIQHHWALEAFADNIGPLSEIVSMAGHVVANVEATALADCLLRPPSVGQYSHALSDNAKNLQGIGIYYHNERARACFTFFIHSNDDECFGKKYNTDMTLSEKGTTAFSRLYPSTKPPHPEMGGWNGLFTDLTMYTMIGINPRNNNDCLTKVEGGLFKWSDATIKKLQDAKISGADLQSKQTTFVCCMLEFMYDLMINADADIANTPFKPFMGRTMNLRG